MRVNARLPRTIGQRVKKHRKNSDYTQERLAEMVGISRAYMGYIEQGRNAPSLEVLSNIAKALRVPLKELL